MISHLFKDNFIHSNYIEIFVSMIKSICLIENFTYLIPKNDI